jgi:glycosyltransferase involved in cell wall biosynthesis
MKKGIIIPCYNIEEDVNLSNILSIIHLYTQLHFCFVNNGSTDNTLSILECFKENSDQDVSVIDMKKKKSDIIVIRGGIRYLNTKKGIGSIDEFQLDFSKDIDELITCFKISDF